MDERILAYLAGAMDSDGSFGIKRSTYSMRVLKESTQPVYSERAALKQVTEAIPCLLKECFGGYVRVCKPQTVNSKPMFSWNVTDTNAARCCAALLPFLRVKHEQAKCLLELRESKDRPEYKKLSYWFSMEFPDWRNMPMVTYTEAARIIGYSGKNIIGMVGQAVKNGSLLAIPYDHSEPDRPRIPHLLVERYADPSRGFKGKRRPLQLIAIREALVARCRELNKIGVGEHPIYMRTGYYKPVPDHPVAA